jgi:8-oxo-dGTP pyrophosphatase MutT (NUDIX family)
VARQHGPWQILNSTEVYRDPWLAVRRDDVIRPDNQPGTHCFVWMKPGVSVLALDNEGNVYLTDEFHYAVGADVLEVVSGGMEPGEAPLEAAKRELVEELGILARRWDELGLVNPFTSIVYSPTSLFLARDLEFVADAPEGSEIIRRVKIPLATARDWALDGKIHHAPSALAILKTVIRLGVTALEPS